MDRHFVPLDIDGYYGRTCLNCVMAWGGFSIFANMSHSLKVKFPTGMLHYKETRIKNF